MSTVNCVDISFLLWWVRNGGGDTDDMIVFE